MNASPEKEMINPWQNRDGFAKIETRNIAFSLMVIFLCALAIPLAFFFESISLLILAALFVYAVAMVRKPFPVTLLLMTAFLAVAFTGSFAAGAVALSLIVGVGASAFLFTAMERSYLLLLLPAAACGISFAVLGDWKISLLAFAFLPSAILLAVATRLGKNRTTAICFAEVGLLLIGVGILWYLLSTESAKLGISALEYIEHLREELVQLFLKTREELLQSIRENASEEEIRAFEEVFSEGLIRDMVAQLVNVLPALCCVLCSIVAFEAQMLLNSIYRAIGWKEVLTLRASIFTMSVPAAVIYFVTFLISLFSTGFSMPMAVMENLNLILLPGFCVIGLTMLLFSFAHAKGGARILWIVLAAAVLCCYSTGALSLLALFGANSVVLGAMRRKMMDKMQNNGNDPQG